MDSRSIAAVMLLWSAVLSGGWAGARATAAEPAGVSEVWALEDAYWRYLKAGDVESYVTLWHPDFIGWPCDQPRPLRKASIGDRVRKVRDEKIAVVATLTREGAQAFGDIVVVHYGFTNVSTYPDGRVEGAGVERKITHTWMRVGDTWQIIGGMCGNIGEIPG
jgi:ketosteroid isomerase-like protein